MRLFLNYARADKPFCIQIVEMLDIHTVWFDQRLYAGQQWWEEILRRLDWCEGFIYLLSPESVVSEYCQQEFKIAMSMGKHIFPILIHAGMAVPEDLSALQYVDFSNGVTSNGVKELLNSIYLAERSNEVTSRSLSAPPMVDVPNASGNITAMIRAASQAMETGRFDQAVFLLEQAIEQGLKSRFVNLEALLAESEAALEQQTKFHSIELEYRNIAELLKYKRTRQFGEQALAHFQQEFPNYDPDNLRSMLKAQVAPWSEVNAEPSITTPERTSCNEVVFTAYCPSQSPVGYRRSLYVYAHLPQLSASVEDDIAKRRSDLGGEVPTARKAHQRPCLAANTSVTIVPECEELEFEPPTLTKKWDGELLRFEFDYRASEQYIDEPLLLRVSVMVCNIEVAHIKCMTEVVGTQEGTYTASRSSGEINPLAAAKLKSASSRLYQRIFVSYSHQDETVILTYKECQRALGNEIFVDSESIRSGEDWQAALASAIDQADVFQLFWSENASHSPHVHDEWDYALKYRCSEDQCRQFIRPVYWTLPMPPPPNELAHLNFRRIALETQLKSS